MRSKPLAIALLLVFAAPAAADWMRDYDTGKKAFDAGNYAAAEASFQSAMRSAADASDRKRFQGTTFRPYMPQHFAGMAAYKLGACDRALQYFQNASNKAAVAKLAELAGEQRRAESDCEQRLAQATAPTTAPVATTPIASTTTPPPPVATTTKPPVAAPPTTTTAPPPPVASTAQVSKPPPATTTVAAPVGAPAPAALVSAVEAFLAGRFADVERSNPQGLTNPRDRAQLLLFRAAVKFLGAELAASDLEPARADVRAARAAYASLQPDPVLFSPRFRSFWRDTR